MIKIPNISIEDYNYPLPDGRIAQYPLQERDQSKLLVYQNKIIQESLFQDIVNFLPKDSLLIYNETKVVQARIPFHKETGARIEIFCLEPVSPTQEIQEAFALSSGVIWKVLVGNSKKWKQGKLSIPFDGGQVFAERLEQAQDYSLVRFEWEKQELSFAEVLEMVGKVPLPPYMKRDAVETDKNRYQTIFACQDGSVAAPTAGLHFTDQVFDSLKTKNITQDSVTLHVGAGTFKPVSSDSIEEHQMHAEQILIHKATIKNLLDTNFKSIIAVGTTTVRSLESLYWFGAKLIKGDADEHINIQQWDPYNSDYQNISKEQSLHAVLQMMKEKGLDVLTGETQLMIAPSYQYRIVNILITNFHQPKSTLLLLVSAMIGEDWKKVYDYALDNDFRFLSYGDACLFFLE